MLGICYGMQLGAEVLAERWRVRRAREFGLAECHVLDGHEPLFQDVPRETAAWMSHGDQVQDAGPDFIAPGRNCDVPGCRGEAPVIAYVGAPVSSRGFAHALWQPDPGKLPGPDLPESA